MSVDFETIDDKCNDIENSLGNLYSATSYIEDALSEIRSELVDAFNKDEFEESLAECIDLLNDQLRDLGNLNDICQQIHAYVVSSSDNARRVISKLKEIV